jgi:hypothetical protein
MALAGEGALDDDLADQLGQVLVTDQGLRARAALGSLPTSTAFINGLPRGPGDLAHLEQGDLHLRAHFGRFCGGIWSPRLVK